MKDVAFVSSIHSIKNLLLADLINSKVCNAQLEYKILRLDTKSIKKKSCSVPGTPQEELDGVYEEPAYNVARILSSRKFKAFKREIGYEYFSISKYLQKYAQTIKIVPVKCDNMSFIPINKEHKYGFIIDYDDIIKKYPVITCSNKSDKLRLDIPVVSCLNIIFEQKSYLGYIGCYIIRDKSSVKIHLGIDNKEMLI